MKKLSCFLFSAFMLGLISCDYVKNPLVPTATTTTPSDSTVIRKVLVEDYTGHECGNCPAAARVITNTLIPTYGEKVVAVAVHAGFFADVSAAPFAENFSTTAGDDYDSPTYFNISQGFGNPAGMINRIHFNSTTLTHIKVPNTWATYVDSLTHLAAVVGIKITCTYISSSRVASINVESKFLTALTGNYKLVVLLTQDSIIAAQKDYATPSPSVVSNYAHRHVLRDAINGTWGEDVISIGNATEGQTVTKFYSYTIPAMIKNIACDDQHCHVVAYIYNAVTYEILQAEEVKVIH